MKPLFAGLSWVLIAAAVQAQPRAVPVQEAVPAPLAEDVTVTSRTKQFRVSGGNQFGRGLCVIMAEDAKRELLQLLEQVDDWKIPISVVLHGEPGDKAPATTFVTRLRVVEGVYRLQLDMHLAEGLKVMAFKRAVTEMLLYERALRSLPQLEENMLLSVPPWLSVGLREASAWRNQQSDRRLYAAMFSKDGAFKVEDLLAVNRAEFAKFDEASLVAFRVCAGAMVMAFLEQAEGRLAFREFLNEAASFEGEMALLLRRHFPDLNLSPNSLAKWWALQLANRGGLNLLTDVMSITDTERELAETLYLHLPIQGAENAAGRERVGIDQWSRLKDLEPKQRLAAVKPAQAALVHLSYRCFPSYRPLLVEYQKQLVRLGRGDEVAMAAALGELTRAREIMAAKSQRGRDYLDWFEITRARETSGVFDDYLRLKKELGMRENDREDAVSLYLERMDKLFNRNR